MSLEAHVRLCENVEVKVLHATRPISETFFKTLQAKLTYHISFKSRDNARKELFSYIELFYNRKRLHSALDYCPPKEYEYIEIKKVT